MKAYLLIETRPGTSEDVVKAIKMRFKLRSRSSKESNTIVIKRSP
ncbi:MAG: hypothetical protein P8X91_08475 [Candidatus Bathyarchaeota archaeon]